MPANNQAWPNKWFHNGIDILNKPKYDSETHLHPKLFHKNAAFCDSRMANLSNDQILNTFKNKGSLLVSMVLWRTFNTHGTFSMHKSFFIVDNVLYIIKMFLLRTVHWKVLWGTNIFYFRA